MSIERDRILSLIEFAQQTARMRFRPVSDVAQHRYFALHEHEVLGLPGIRLNVNEAENDDETWLVVERLHETSPPEITSATLIPWIQIHQGVDQEPTLRETTQGASLIAAGTHLAPATPRQPGASRLPVIEPEATVCLAEYDQVDLVQTQFTRYLSARWRPWAEKERLRRRTIELYSQLFTLKHQLEGGVVETQLELVWGVGVAVWKNNGTNVNYPLVTRLVELSLNPETAEIEIRPRDVDARLEIDWYAAVGNPGVPELEKAAKEFFASAARTFSPFDRSTFESLLRTASTNLDANSTYWPDVTTTTDRKLPRSDSKLKVTDTWVLFARERTSSVLIQDLENLKHKVQSSADYPPVAVAIVTEPEPGNSVVELPGFRGVSATYHAGRGSNSGKGRDLYFPKPFNDEQVRIVQLLEVSDGVVVQGPPGTGKTHTIANVICHYLAHGKRVLVTSMKDAALSVLHQQLPDPIRPLAISLLTSEQEGMKQFEHAIQKIASEVQRLDRARSTQAIRDLESMIDSLHAKLARIDSKIGGWAKKNLEKITLDSEEVHPLDAARAVLEGIGQFEWIPDELGVGPEFAPQFSDADVARLREARRVLGDDIDYLGASLPQLAELPDPGTLLQVHQDLIQFEQLRLLLESGRVPALADSSQRTLARAQKLVVDIGALKQMRNEVALARKPWTAAMRERLRRGSDDRLVMLEVLGAELEQAAERHKAFLDRPVTTPPGMELDGELIRAVANLAEARSPFGLRGVLGKSNQKQQLARILVLGGPPADAESWRHVAKHLELCKHLRGLSARWNALARELPIEAVGGQRPEDGLAAIDAYAHYHRIRRVVLAEAQLCRAAAQVFPNWPHACEVADSAERLAELEAALQHHLTKSRLVKVLDKRDRLRKLLDGRSGRIIDLLRGFFHERLGNPTVTDAEMQAEWADATAELSRVLALRTYLTTVREVCDQIERSGAPRFAAALKQPNTGLIDSLLPDNWRKCWRLRRLATYLDSIDGQKQLKKLAKDRHDVELELLRAYQELVMHLTWLRLAENASPSIRAALQAYLNAIQKIGKGTGKRAVRYRKDARVAAYQANPAIPCWIMAHYRVSESMPAELGCFDLVVIDEASQSDLTALPSLLRARKVLIVGDDKQVSPEGVGLEEEKVRSLMNRFLGNQVETYRQQMSPERSIYDLFKVVFASNMVMLKEHFRCVPPIIEYSKREFYNHELRPLRVPKASERLDPPLIDVLVEDGYRDGDINLAEARFVVSEIKAIVRDPILSGRSIGVVSLLADKQARKVWELLTQELGPELMQHHRIACGDARTFQGKERDIMFLTMVVARNTAVQPLSRDTFAQRFNVAASRARDRMYLVRSVGPEDLSEADRLRVNLIKHFIAPFAQDQTSLEDLEKRCESQFEREMYHELTQRGYRVVPQVGVGQYRIDLVVEGRNDARLAVECDGDSYHGPDRWVEDMQRQRALERAGWVFWRCFASAFIRRRVEMLEDLVATLTELGVEPIGAEGAVVSVHCERRVVCAFETPVGLASPPAIQVVESDEAHGPSLSHQEESAVSARGERPEAMKSVTVADPLVGAIAHRLPAETLVCPECRGRREVRIGRFGPYLKCTHGTCPCTDSVPREAIAEALVDVVATCPACSAPVKVAKGRAGLFVGCSRYPGCRESVPWKKLGERLPRR